MSHSGLASTPASAARAGGDQDQRSRGRRTPGPITNFAGLVGSWPRAASQSQSQAKTGARVKMKNELTLWNQLLGKRQAEDLGARVAIGEQVERRAGLFEDRPEQRRGEEQHGDDVQPPALGRRPVAGEEQPAEEADRQSRSSTPAASATAAAVIGTVPVAAADAEHEHRAEKQATPQLRLPPGARRLRRRRGAGSQAGVAEQCARAQRVLDDAAASCRRRRPRSRCAS